jgi:hypothetical protein
MNKVDTTKAIRQLIDLVSKQSDADYFPAEKALEEAKAAYHGAKIRRNQATKEINRLQALITVEMAEATDEANRLDDEYAFKQVFEATRPKTESE